MKLYFGLSNDQVREFHKRGWGIARKYKFEYSGWVQDINPQFQYDKYDYTVIVGKQDNLSIIDFDTDYEELKIGKGPIYVGIGDYRFEIERK